MPEKVPELHEMELTVSQDPLLQKKPALEDFFHSWAKTKTKRERVIWAMRLRFATDLLPRTLLRRKFNLASWEIYLLLV
jgi:hypothetical protein